MPGWLRTEKNSKLFTKENEMRYQCYYNETIFIESNEGYPVPVTGEKVIIPEAIFDTEDEAEKYCLHHFGSQKCGDEWVDNEVRYEEVE